MMQAALEGPQISQGRLEAPPVTTDARIFSITKEDAANASTVVTAEIIVFNQYATVLFDTGATHSFISTPFTEKIDMSPQTLDGKFLTTLPSGYVMPSTHILRAAPVRIADRELYCNLIVLDMWDYDIILGMDFLSKYGASIECGRRRVVFRPEAEPTFEFIGENKKEVKKFLSALKAQKMLDSGYTGFLAHVIDINQKREVKPEDVKVVCNYPEVFPDELPGLAPD
ncbi:uncharacterized protein LOC122050201 [Zingiber officinale]|uniref:uncharacterized protein LOC122050201 n=1 Tax=Zingiber officinale TaxID=94328 RepID=UPI001C4B7FE2|nr:uncharacterized protein LOC122050201 [Zingiber officinale]